MRLRPGASLAAFTRRATALARRYPATQGVGVTDLTVQQAKVEQAIQPQADALALFAALAALAAVVVAGQLLSRQLLAGAAEYPGLSALGMDRGQLFVLGLARAGLVTAAGAVIAAAAAVAASPLMPIGPARLAEPDPGVQVNVAVLGLGLLVVALVPLLVVAPVAWHTAGTARARGDPQPDRGASSRLAAALTWLGGVPSAAIGIRMAVEPGRGRGAVPVRSALAGTALAVAAVVAAAVFGASLTQLVDTPRLYGQDWDLGLSAGYGAVPVAGSGSLLAATPGAAYAGANFGPVTVDGQPVAAVGIQPLRGQVFLTLLAGRRRPAGTRSCWAAARCGSWASAWVTSSRCRRPPGPGPSPCASSATRSSPHSGWAS